MGESAHGGALTWDGSEARERPLNVARLGAVIVTRLEALAAILRAADDSGDELRHAQTLRRGRGRVCGALRALETASLTPGSSQELPGRWPEPWDDGGQASTRRPSVLVDRIARGEGTVEQIRALAAAYRRWTRDYCDSMVDALMLELVETAPKAREKLALALVRLGEDACVALCAEVRDLEDAGGVWIVATRQRRTKGGVFFALIKARYAWARFGAAHRGVRAANAPPNGAARDRQGADRSTGAGRERSAAPATTPPVMEAPVSTTRPAARQASCGSPDVIVLRRRGGVSEASTEGIRPTRGRS